MTKVAIITDSTSDLSPEIVSKYGIKVLPLKVVYKDREYRDGVDISPEEVYQSFDKEVPTTSLPSPAEILDLFNDLKAQGYTHAISIHISSGLSGTSNAVKLMAEQMTDFVVEVVDSKTLSMGLGRIVLAAAEVLEKTGSFSDAIEKAKAEIEKSKTFFIVATLDYLRRGGRIGLVAGTVGELLQIKPLISINEEGVYYTHSKVRGRKKSITNLFDIMKEEVEKGPTRVAVLHGGAEEEARELMEKIKEFPNVRELYFGQIGPVMVVHTGPGLIGVTYSPV